MPVARLLKHPKVEAIANTRGGANHSCFLISANVCVLFFLKLTEYVE